MNYKALLFALSMLFVLLVSCGDDNEPESPEETNPFGFRIDSISTTKAKPDQILDINGVFSDNQEQMTVYLVNEDTKTACQIQGYTPSFMRVIVDKNLAVGIYELVVSYAGNDETIITYPEKIEITDVIPSISFLSAYTLDPETDGLFIVGKNLKPQKETKATVRFADRDDTMELFGRVFNLPGSVYGFDYQDIIYVENLSILEEKSYNCTVIIDGVISDNSYILKFEKNLQRPQIQGINNLNPSEGEIITISGSGFGHSSYIILYAQIVENSDIYLPVYQIEENSYELINGKECLIFEMPKIDNISNYKLKISYFSVESDFSEIITLK